MAFHIDLSQCSTSHQADLLLSTQHKWKTASLISVPHSLDATLLARAPLVDLRLFGHEHQFTNVSDVLVFSFLTVLHVRDCHESLLTLLTLAPNLHEFHFHIPRQLETPLPPMHFQHLRRLLVVSSAPTDIEIHPTFITNPVLDALTCPALLDLHVHPDPPVLQSFIERSKPSLLSAHFLVLTASDLLPSLTLLPSLLSLTLVSAYVSRFFTAMSTICPRLQDVQVVFAKTDPDLASFVYFINSRWRAPDRSLRRVITNGLSFVFDPSTNPNTLPVQLQPLSTCIEEGLDFQACELRPPRRS